MDHLKKVWSHSIFWLLVSLIAVAAYTPARAQNKSDQSGKAPLLKELSDAEVGQHANELIKKLNSQSTQGRRYTEALKDAGPEDRLVLELQIASLRKRIVDNLQQLGDALLELEKSGSQSELRGAVEKIYVDAIPRLWSHIGHLRAEIDKARGKRPKANASESYTLENEIAKLTKGLDESFDMGLRLIQKMEAIGMETKSQQAELTRLLYDRVDELSGRTALAQARMDTLEVRTKDFPDDADAAKLLKASINSLQTNTTSMLAMLDLMDELEIDTTALRSDLMTMTRDLSSGLTDTGVAVSLLKRALNKTTDWLIEKGPGFIVKLLVFLAIIFVFRIAARFTRRAVKKAIGGSNLNLSELAGRMLVNTVANLVMLFGIMLALSQLGISLGPLLAGLGVAGFIIGFALQDSLGNFASGIMILLYRPYDVGDLVEVGDVFGKVHKMTLVSTSMLTLDNQTILIPNNKIWGDVIKNVTAQDIRRIDMVFGIAYSDDIPKAEKILENILDNHDRVLEDPEPVVRVHTLGASSVDFVVRPWVKVDDYWDVYWDVTRAVKMRFDEEEVSIPFPQQDVHFYYEQPPSSDTAKE